MNTLFFEVLIAPGYDEAALTILKSKKNRIIIQQKARAPVTKTFKNLLNGVLEQDADTKAEGKNEFKVVTTIAPTEQQLPTLLLP